MIFGIRDDSELGGTQAYQEAGLDVGKSALIKVMADVYPLDSGTYVVGGSPATEDPPRRG